MIEEIFALQIADKSQPDLQQKCADYFEILLNTITLDTLISNRELQAKISHDLDSISILERGLHLNLNPYESPDLKILGIQISEKLELDGFMISDDDENVYYFSAFNLSEEAAAVEFPDGLKVDSLTPRTVRKENWEEILESFGFPATEEYLDRITYDRGYTEEWRAVNKALYEHKGFLPFNKQLMRYSRSRDAHETYSYVDQAWKESETPGRQIKQPAIQRTLIKIVSKFSK